MKWWIKKKSAFLLAFLMTFSSLQPAFPAVVFAEPATVSAPVAEETTVSTVEAETGAEISADIPANEPLFDDGAVIAEENAGNDVSGNEIPGNDSDDQDEQTGLSTIVIDGFEYGTGAVDDEGIEIIDHPEDYDEEEAAGSSEADQEKYNADLLYSKMKYVGPVRNQGSTGLCWMFGATSAIESNVRKTYGLEAQDELEISPKYGGWWLFHRAAGSLGGYVDDDWIELRNEPKTEEEITYNAAPTDFAKQNAYTRRGGFNWLSMTAFSQWLGPVNVDDSNRLTCHTKSSLDMLATEPHLTDQNPYRQDFQVQNVNLYSYPLKGKTRSDLEKMVKDGTAGTEIKKMKERIVEHGALAGSMNTNFFNGDKTYCYDPGDPWPYEKDKNRSTKTTHIITFVGWDDTIPKESFSDPSCKNAKSKYFSEEEFTPPGDGAWVCKNSWGDNRGENGFFYISYYDGALRYPFNSFAGYDTVDIRRNETAGKKRTVYDNNYQYNSMATMLAFNDGSGRYDHKSYYASAPMNVKQGRHFGAVYTAQSDETLKAVGITTREEGLTFDIDVYTASSDDLPIGPIGGLVGTGWKHASSASKADYVVKNAGFHTIQLGSDVPVKKGNDFLVVYTMKDRDGDIIIQEGTDPDGKSAKSGRSIDVRGRKYYLENEYYYKKASGYSFDDVNSADVGDLAYESDYDYDIKAFTVNGRTPTPGKSNLEFYSNYENRNLEVGDTINMRQGLIFEPVSVNNVWDEIKEWSSGDESVLTHVGNGVFKALKVSSNAVSVNVVTVSGASASANILVIEKRPDLGISVTLDNTSYDYTGSLISVKNDVTVMSGNTVIYKNGKHTVSGFNVSISENGAKDAGKAVATIVVSLSDDSISNNKVSQNSLLKIADIEFAINPVNISNVDKIWDQNAIEGKEFTEDGAEHKPVPRLFLNNGEASPSYELISRNSTDKNSDAYYEYDYDIEYTGADYSKPGIKTIKLTGYGNFTGEKYINYRIDPKDAEADPTLSKNGLYVSKISPQTVPYTGNRHVVKGVSKKKSGFNYDLGLDVRYDGKDLVEGRDYKISYYNNLAANVGIADAKEPYLVVNGLGKYKGLSAKRYFAIAPAELNEENTRVSGLKAVYPVNVAKTDKAVINPVFTFAVVDDTGRLVKKKLKKAVKNKTTGKVTGDYELKYYRFLFYEEDEFPSGEEEEPIYGEWKEIEGDSYTYSGSGEEDIVLVAAKGINNFAGMSAEIVKETGDPEPWPAGKGMTVVTNSLTTPGNGTLKGSSVKKIVIPDKYKKLTAEKRSFSVAELMQDTVMQYSYKNAQGKNTIVDIKANGDDFYHYLSVYNSENVEIFEIDQPGSYTVRVTGIGSFAPDQLKGQTGRQALVASKDVKLNVSGSAKLKASDFKLQYKKNDKWEDAGTGLKLDYDGNSNEFRIVKKDGSELPENDYSVEGFLNDNASPGKYTFTLHGRGMYGGSKAAYSFTRNKLDLKKALDVQNGGKLEIKAFEESTYASAFGAMPVITAKNGYEEGSTVDKVDTSICTRWHDLSFSGKKNISAGEEGKLVIKAENESPFKGTAEIPVKIVRYDLAKLQGKKFLLPDVSEDAITNSGRVFIYADDVYSESAVPNVIVYQYDSTGTQRKQLAIDKSRLSAPVNKGSNEYVVTLKNEADKSEVVDFGTNGTEIPVRVLKEEQKAKKLEITAGDFMEISKKGAKFTGRAICPSVTKVKATMKDGSVKELNEDAFFVDYESNVTAGTAKVIVYAIGKSDYSETVSGKQVFTFKIK